MKYIIGAFIGALIMVSGQVHAIVPEDEVWFPLIKVITDLTNEVTALQNENAQLKTQCIVANVEPVVIPVAVAQTPEVQAPSTPVYNVEEPLTGNTPQTGDTVAPLVDLVSIDKIGNTFVLRVVSNEELDIVQTTGIELGNVRANGTRNAGNFKRTKELAYYYEVVVTEPQENSVSITLKDLVGNAVTRPAQVNR